MVGVIIGVIFALIIRRGIMENEMTLNHKLDYLIEIAEYTQSKVEKIEEDQEELIEKINDLGTPYGPGFEFEQ